MLIAENGHDYVEVDPRPRRRSVWWWLAFTGAVAWFSAAAWISYRALAGHPILGGLLARLGG